MRFFLLVIEGTTEFSFYCALCELKFIMQMMRNFREISVSFFLWRDCVMSHFMSAESLIAFAPQSNFNLPTQSALHPESLYFLQQWAHNKPVYYTARYTYLCGIKKRESLPPHYAELRDTMGSPKHKTGRECSGFCTGGITQVSCHYLTIDTTGLCILLCVRWPRRPAVPD